MRANRLVAATALFVLSGCATSGHASAAPSAVAQRSATTTPTTRVLGVTTQAASAPCGRTTSARYTHVIWIWMENRSYTQVLGSSGSATRLKSYGRRCGVATNYYAISHPSLPNYLAAVAGTTGGVTSDCSPSTCLQHRASLFGQVSQSGHYWRSFAENMQHHCDRASYGSYAARHNPAVYFSPIHSSCLQWDVAMGGTSGPFAKELQARTLRAFTFITPNLCDDGHDCSTSTADTWLGGWLDRIVASPAYAAGHTAVFVTWDEGLRGSDNRVATVVVAPSVTPGTQNATRFTHYSLLRTAEELLGLPLLGQAKYAHSMRPML